MKKEQVSTKQTPRDSIDLRVIHNRIESTKQMLTQEIPPDSKENRSILREKARILAQKPEEVATAKEFLSIIEFRLGTETYGIESAFISEVYPLKDFTPLPGVPPFVLGIVNVHGKILSIIDLKKCFNMPEKGLGQLNILIILHNDQMEFGILADDIYGTYPIALDTIQAAPSTITGINAEYLRGVTAERVIILDARNILEDEKIIVDHNVE